RRLLRLGREDMAAIAELRGGDRQHAAKLAATDDADGGAGVDDRRSGHSGESATPSAWRARHSSSRAASRRSAAASIAAASRPALTAPARPMASVPTGTPAGIWTIDSRLSMPDSALDSTGTPSTGSRVIDAAMPGRWA